ncbi:group II trans-sialidase superfamily [Trypanosoma rangeli]|uniref:Group II trans-sialidase superfamily n=1 Tax=Trypanosoma rangeli TaxID=5698 RepID=A0A3R7JVB3_TRYRA|nr:group II trans-sialidase superfamily [Trypanosoma rangeli]RNE97396.1 group II trans-sialidase superfamily [Trypanosoma rangeli]|eukprot:RNE97396.1 group II trans-sialidase superfamily [Trypanosoma rangeli]
MPKMSRYPFFLAVRLLFVLLICFGNTAVHAEEGNTPKEVQIPNVIDIFVPNRTIVETQGESQMRDSFAFPSLVSAGGVLVALARGHRSFKYSTGDRISVDYADVVAGYIDSTESWSSFVDEVNANRWKSHNIFPMSVQVEHKPHVRCVLKPTTVAKGSKVFLLVGGHYLKYDPSSKSWIVLLQGLDLLVGEATQDKLIQWGKPTSLLSQIEPSAEQRGLDRFAGGGGSGVVMEDGTLVFPVTARDALADTVSMIIYSKDDGKNWLLPQGMLPAGCIAPLIVEWEQGQLLMVAQCKFGPNVFESRDMGETWTEAGWTLTGVQPRFSSDFLQLDWSVTSFTTATIAGKKVMLYTQEEVPPGERVAKALYLWVADNNRTFHVGPISVDTAEKWTSANTLLHSKDALHLLQERVSTTTTGLFLAPLTKELKTITSVLETWAKLDSFLSNSSVPTAGLVGFLSDASCDGNWNDAYRCVNATVRNAKKVEDGFNFTGSESYAMWPVNMRTHHYVHSFVNYAFTLVATVTIDEIPNEGVPLLGAGLEDKGNRKFVALSYTTDKRWVTVFDGITKTIRNSTWEPGKEYKVALMLQGNEGSVYVDGVLVGSSDTLPILKSRRHDITHFYFGGGKDGKDGSARVRNVFLYNYPLSEQELKKVDDSSTSEERAGDNSDASEQLAGDTSTRADVSRLLLLLLGLCGFAVLC